MAQSDVTQAERYQRYGCTFDFSVFDSCAHLQTILQFISNQFISFHFIGTYRQFRRNGLKPSRHVVYEICMTINSRFSRLWKNTRYAGSYCYMKVYEYNWLLLTLFQYIQSLSNIFHNPVRVRCVGSIQHQVFMVLRKVIEDFLLRMKRKTKEKKRKRESISYFKIT